jgi:hypothetical protein
MSKISDPNDLSSKKAFEILRDFDDKCPSEHGHRHAWVGQRAWDLIHGGMSEEEAREQLLADTRHVPAERNIEKDIDEAIRTAIRKRDGIDLPRRKAMQGTRTRSRTSELPEADEKLIQEITTKYRKVTYSRLHGDSPTIVVATAGGILSMLFKPGMLVCCGRVKNDPGEIWPVETWAKNEETLSSKALIVPNPMIARYVCDENGLLRRTPTGKPSVRLLENVAERRYLITEFDQASQDDSARLAYHLADYMPLVMIVDTVGKSPHYWWVCVGESPGKVEAFFDLACKLGADPAHWRENQYCRLPGGWRDEFKDDGTHIVGRQKVVYFDPSRLPE